MNDSIRVLLVEDEPLWQQGIKLLLAEDSRFELVDVVDCYEAAIAAFQQYQPHVVLLDWKIRGEQDGLAVGEYLLASNFPPERVVVISGSTPSSIPQHPFLFVPKSRLSDELLPILGSLFLKV